MYSIKVMLISLCLLFIQSCEYTHSPNIQEIKSERPGSITQNTSVDESNRITWKTPWGLLYCKTKPELISLIRKQNFEVTHVQSSMWMKLKSSSLTPHHQLLQELPYKHPAEIKAGDWLMNRISAHDTQSTTSIEESIEFLIVEKPVPWIGNRSKYLGHCHVNQAFKAITRSAVGLENQLVKSLSLNLEQSHL